MKSNSSGGLSTRLLPVGCGADVKTLGDALQHGLDEFTLSMFSVPQTLHEACKLLPPAVTQLYDDVHLLCVLEHNQHIQRIVLSTMLDKRFC